MSSIENLDPFGILRGPAHLEEPPTTHDEDEVVAAFETKLKLAEDAKSDLEHLWEFQKLMQRGEQLIVRRRSTGEVLKLQIEDDSRTKYSIDNLLRPTSRAFVGKMIRIIPDVAVMARSEDRDDMLAAETLEAYADYISRAQNLGLKYKRSYDYVAVFGTAIQQPCWDPAGGRSLSWCQQCDYVSEDEEPGTPCFYCEMEAQAQAEMQNQQAMMQAQQSAMMGLPTAAPQPVQPPPAPPLIAIKEGAVAVKVIDPRDFFMDPGAVEIEDAQWAMVRHVMPVSKARQLFPEAAEKLKEESGLYLNRTAMFAGDVRTVRVTQNQLQDYVAVWEYHEMPSGEYPDGRILYVGNRRILREGPNTYATLFGQLGFTVFRGDRDAGEFWGESYLTQATPLQKERNELLTQMRTNRRMTINPPILNPAGNGLTIDRPLEPGREYKFRSALGGPRPMETAMLPPYCTDEVMRMHQAIREKAAVTDQEVGLTSGDPSGRYAALLESQATEAVSPLLIENNAEWVKLYRFILLLGQEYESPTKKWLVQGESSPKSYSWDGVQLGWDVYLAESDSLSKNPALRLQQAIGLWNIGYFVDPATGMPNLKLFSKVAGLKMPGVGPDMGAAEHALAARLPEMLARGEQFKPAIWDDADTWAEELMYWLKTHGRTADPQLVMQVAQHWLQYALALRDPMSGGLQPNPGLQGGPQKPGQPGQQGQQGQQSGATMGAGAMPENQSAAQLVQSADQGAEQNARMQENQEGSTVG